MRENYKGLKKIAFGLGFGAVVGLNMTCGNYFNSSERVESPSPSPRVLMSSSQYAPSPSPTPTPSPSPSPESIKTEENLRSAYCDFGLEGNIIMMQAGDFDGNGITEMCVVSDMNKGKCVEMKYPD